MKLAPYIFAFAIGFALCHFLFQPKIVESIVIKTEERIDTLYTHHIDTVYLTDTLLQERIDTVYYSIPHQSTLTAYSGRENLEYGFIDWKAETTGKLVDFKLTPILNLPTIVKEIETVKTVTRTRDLRGLYAGAGVSQGFDYKLGASYVDMDWQFNYDYQPKLGVHWVGVRKRVF